jgi:hypothetical protein
MSRETESNSPFVFGPLVFPMTRPTHFQRLLDWLPGVRLLWHYDRGCLPQDLAAGLVVTLVLIPSAIAYAGLEQYCVEVVP